MQNALKMKKWNFFFVGLLVLVFCSCEGLFYNPSSKVVKFRASAGDDVRTRTAYTNHIDPATGKERIEWETGDPVMIYMYWKSPEGSTETNNPVHEAIYTVSFNNHISNERSYGELISDNSPLMWKGDDSHVYTHYFYSIYPAGKGFFYTSTDDGSNPSIEFSLPANQDGKIKQMQYAYMAAAAPAVTTKYNDNYSTTIDLDYYPMVTTVYVDITNNSSRAISEVILTSTDDDVPLVGNYTVNFASRQIGSRPFGTNLGESSGDEASNANRTVTIPSVITSNSSKKIAFFVRPRMYENNLDLKFKWGEETKSVGSLGTVTPFSKYNIKVTINENGDIDFDDALAQFILVFMREFRDGDIFYNEFKDFIDDYFNGDYLDFWNNHFPKDNVDKQLDGALDILKSIFSDENGNLNMQMFNAFIDALGNVENLNITEGYKVLSSTLRKDFFSLFKNVKHIKLRLIHTAVTVEIEGLEYLETLEFVETNQKVSLTVKDCPSFRMFEFPENNVEVTGITLIRTPYFKEGYVRNSNQPNIHITLEDCSTAEENAFIRFYNQNFRDNPSRSGNTDNIVIEAGYQDVDWSQGWPPIYGDWHTTWSDK